LQEYLDLVKACNNKGEWSLYPGSPEIIRRTIRAEDRIRLFELHPTDHDLLAEHFERDRQTKVFKGDGFAALKALLPPPTKRGVIFMDPPYDIIHWWSRCESFRKKHWMFQSLFKSLTNEALECWAVVCA
jgi:23S rRNA (adenine2030-N6)-methyltransferase